MGTDTQHLDHQELGFKRLTPDNWLQFDSTNVMLGPIEHPDAVVAYLAEVQLSRSVPIEVVRLFEIAKGAMCYGYVFYPLWTLAAEQLFRVAESAVAAKCVEFEAGRSVRTFAKRIDYLRERIPAAMAFDWHSLRRMRNEASHRDAPMALSPRQAVPVVKALADAINRLFEAA